MKKGILYFHQGYADIFNCCGLIDHYMTKYDELLVLCIERARDLINFYIKNKSNVSVLFIKHFTSHHNQNIVNYLKQIKNIQVNDYDLLFHGVHESERIDKYNNGFSLAMQKNNFFVKSFYIGYDINYKTRVESFNITRDLSLENATYDNFINKYGKNYILYHETIETERKNNIAYIDITCMTTIFFDYIKILENSIELHFKDSAWSVFTYLLDCKYRLFKNKKIVVYVTRDLSPYYDDPVKLDNWIIKS